MLSLTWSALVGYEERRSGVGRTYVADADVLDHLEVELGAILHFGEELEQHAVEGGVFEAAFACFGEGRANGEGDDDCGLFLV